MEELLYTAFDVACIVDNLGLSTKQTIKLAKQMHNVDKNYISTEYRESYRNWVLDILYWSEYMEDKIALDAEFPSIQAISEGKVNIESMMRSNFNIDLFFKKLRIQILFLGKKNYTRMKLRTIMAEYGYKRRSKEFVKFLKYRLMFYHIQTALRGKDVCDIETMSNIDDMITFRII